MLPGTRPPTSEEWMKVQEKHSSSPFQKIGLRKRQQSAGGSESRLVGSSAVENGLNGRIR